jgi:hypothetical protein
MDFVAGMEVVLVEECFKFVQHEDGILVKAISRREAEAAQ